MIIKLKIKNIMFILIGAAIMSFGLVNFNMQNKLAEGGFTGITLLFYFLFKWDPSYTNLLLNIPLFIIGWKSLGKTYFSLYHHRNTCRFHFFMDFSTKRY